MGNPRMLIRRIRRADEETRNAWLLIVCLLVGLTCAVEAMTRATDAIAGMGPMGMVAAFAFTGLTVVAAFRPVGGGLLMLLGWVAFCVSPVAMPSGMMLGAMIAVSVLAYAHRGLGVMAALAATGAWMFARGGWTTDWSARPGDGHTILSAGHTILGAVTLNGVLPVAILFLCFLLGGVAVRWGHDRDRAEAELTLRRNRERAAQDIHDYVSNDLAYVILRLDRDIADGGPVGTGELRELREAAAKALGHTHEVIALLERDDRPGGAGAIKTADAAVAVEPIESAELSESMDQAAIDGLRDQCALYERRLASLGFDGQTIITAQPGARLSTAVRELLGGLVEELYTNIGKHADPADGYVLTLRLSRAGVDIALVDAPVARAASDMELSTGTGLGRYRARIERMGGTLQVREADGEWSLAVGIPSEREGDNSQ